VSRPDAGHTPFDRPQRDVDQVDWLRIKIPILALKELMRGPEGPRVREVLARWHSTDWCSQGPVLDAAAVGTEEGAQQELWFLLEDLLERMPLGAETVEVASDCIRVTRREETPEVGFEEWCASCKAVHQFPGLRWPDADAALPMRRLAAPRTPSAGSAGGLEERGTAPQQPDRTAPRPAVPPSSDEERVPRKVRGLIFVDYETDGTVMEALEGWVGAVEGCLEDTPMYAFVEPAQPYLERYSESERQFHIRAAIEYIRAAIEYIEMEYRDGVPMHPNHIQRLRYVLSGEPLSDDHPVQGGLRIPWVPRDQDSQ